MKPKRPTQRKGIGNGWINAKTHKEALCTLIPAPGTVKVRGNDCHFTFKSSRTEGQSLHKCKALENAGFFADFAAHIASGLVDTDRKADYVVVAAPKRRHPIRNFAEAVAMKLADKLGVRFIPDAFVAITHARMDPQINLRRPFAEPNVILYDDILTTGQTLMAMEKHLNDKNIIRIIGINNTK